MINDMATHKIKLIIVTEIAWSGEFIISKREAIEVLSI